MADQPPTRWRLSIRGIVQGVGFRPFVHQLANELGLVGWVGNDTSGVVVEVQGHPAEVERFAALLPGGAPPLASIASIDRVVIEPLADTHFVIRASRGGGRIETPVGADAATCEQCLVEIFDPEGRRYRYPFTNCTNCGPRYSIITGVPYDRANTTMATFEMCPDCRAEYTDPGDRRFHAQPICCPACGPALDRPIGDVVAALLAGRIVALKGVGGYHLAVRAADAEAVQRLRSRKYREDKPFAIMAPDLPAVQSVCHLSAAEEELLTSPARPIVLLRRRHGDGAGMVAEAVAPGCDELGIMLPYTPLHHLLLAELAEPMVCTSANLSDEPIAYRDDDARRRLSSITDVFQTNNRPIHIRIDDSVVRVVGDRPYPIRRSRGYAPAPLRLSAPIPRPLLACGAELKNVIAYGRGHDVHLSHHIGDLKSHETHESFLEAIAHLGRLLDIEPEVVAHDRHPDYLSTAYATEQVGVELVAVQHHHAHVAACLADADHAGPVIGVAFDGAGFGDDGTIWGGEFLVADAETYARVGWLEPVPMPGGDAATRQPWRMAASYLSRMGGDTPSELAVIGRHHDWADVTAIARAGLNSPLTSSAGRLFDAVSALLDVRDEINYEGQAAIELERLADRADEVVPHASIRSDGGTHVVAGSDLVAAAVGDLQRGVGRPAVAMRFHRGLAGAVVGVCGRIRGERGVDVVALSGGVFLNRILLVEVIASLEEEGFTVLRHQRVPCNDGGISFGQTVVAAALDRAGRIG